jgi:hypothetical protein
MLRSSVADRGLEGLECLDCRSSGFMLDNLETGRYVHLTPEIWECDILGKLFRQWNGASSKFQRQEG